jgi:hypothetical protein
MAVSLLLIQQRFSIRRTDGKDRRKWNRQDHHEEESARSRNRGEEYRHDGRQGRIEAHGNEARGISNRPQSHDLEVIPTMTDEQWLRLVDAQSAALDATLGANRVLVMVLSVAAALSEQLTIQGESMAAEMDRLAEEVTQNKDVQASAITLLSNLSARVRDAAGDRTKATALADELDANSNALAAAVAANTIAEGGGAPETSTGAPA